MHQCANGTGRFRFFFSERKDWEREDGERGYWERGAWEREDWARKTEWRGRALRRVSYYWKCLKTPGRCCGTSLGIPPVSSIVIPFHCFRGRWEQGKD